MKKNQSLNIIDLFCGCGGFSLGAHLAGFNSVLSVDIDKTLSSSYPLNFPNSKLRHYDLAKVGSEQLLQDCGEQKVHGVIGGPPCQGFSTMGRRDSADPRNALIGHYFRHIKHIRPDFFVMENVPGILAGAMKEKLEEQLKSISKHYKVIGPMLVTASAFGAATKRQRIIVIGYDPTQFEAFDEKNILALCSDTSETVRNAIGDLPDPISQAEDSLGWARFDKRKKVSPYAMTARKLPPKGLGCDEAISKLQEGYVSGLMDTKHTKEIQKRYAAVEAGRADKVSKSFKLEWGGLCPTLRAGTGSEKGSYQAVRPLHPEQGRVITVREAARLQGFPDWFVFHQTKWHSFRMIGNSVSPYLSHAILSYIKTKIRK